MRVIAGRIGGRLFDAPNGHRTHPMSEKIRGSIFNALGNIEELTVLDAYSGSGAMAIEAISRGAASIVAIDVDRTASLTIKNNILNLGISPFVKVIRANVHAWSAEHREQQFDLVLCDPPYDDAHATNIQKLLYHVKPGGLLVLSWPGSQTVPKLDGARCIEDKHFGDAMALFYRKQ